MAISATMVWEIRSDATASCVNGGGFNSAKIGVGTDYSQQPNAQYTFSNLASTAASGWLVVTSTSHNFVTADEGNIIHITTTGTGAHFATGWYEIISTAGNAATLDRACGSVADASGGTFYVGGALSWNDGNTSTAINNATTGNIFYVRGGTYATGSGLSPTPLGVGTTPFVIKGYDATGGRSVTPVGTNRPTITSSFAGAGPFQMPTAGYWDIYNIVFIGTATTSQVLGIQYTKLINCKVVYNGTAAGKVALQTGGVGTIINCEFVSYRGPAINISVNGHQQLFGNYIHDSDIGIEITNIAGKATISNNIIANNVTAAIKTTVGVTTAGLFIFNNLLYGAENQTGIGYNLNTGTTLTSFWNNIIYGFTTGVSHADAQTVSYDDYNNYYNNGTDNTNWTKGSHDLALNPSFTNVTQIIGTTATTTSTQLVDSGANFGTVTDNQDYVYISSGTGVGITGVYLITGHDATHLTLSPAPPADATPDKHYQITTGRNWGIGTNLQAGGSPGLFPGSNTTGYLDIGAVQRQIDLPATSKVEHGIVYDNGLKTGSEYVPAASDVRFGVNVDATTGTCKVPTAANTKIGVATDVSDTGTYDGSDRWSDPDQTFVYVGINYKANSLTNNRTGTLDLPSSSAIATAVWDEPLSTHTNKAKFGGFTKTLLTVAEFLGLK